MGIIQLTLFAINVVKKIDRIFDNAVTNIAIITTEKAARLLGLVTDSGISD